MVHRSMILIHEVGPVRDNSTNFIFIGHAKGKVDVGPRLLKIDCSRSSYRGPRYSNILARQ